jgi:hypothetical protein
LFRVGSRSRGATKNGLQPVEETREKVNMCHVPNLKSYIMIMFMIEMVHCVANLNNVFGMVDLVAIAGETIV